MLRWTRENRLTGGAAAIIDVWPVVELLANLKPLSMPNSNVFSEEASYPHPWREFKLLKKEDVYNLDVTKLKMRYLERKNIVNVLLALSSKHIWNEKNSRAAGL